MFKYLMILGAVFLPLDVAGQSTDETLDLQYLYEQLEENYPTAKKQKIQKEITSVNLRLAQADYYPNISFKARASYQSEVTDVPFAPVGMAPAFSKDHYNISMELNQPIFEGGKTRSLKAIESATGEAEMAAIQSEIWIMRNQLEQVYFEILLLQKRKASIELHIKTVDEQLNAVRAKVNNGILLPADELVMKAEKLKAKQQLIQINEETKVLMNILSLLTGLDTDKTYTLSVPQINIADTSAYKSFNRAELTVLKAKKKTLQSQIPLVRSAALPHLAAFATAGYGRPSLNAFENELQAFWIIGLRAQWNFKRWNEFDKRKSLLQLNQKMISADIEAFQTKLQSDAFRALGRVNTLEEQILIDEELLYMRGLIVKEKEDQLDQGVITSTEYITGLNAERLAQFNLQIRKLQLVKAKLEYLNAKGIEWN